MVVIKRNGTEVPFNINKIVIAIEKTNKDVDEGNKLTEAQIVEIANKVWSRCNKFNRPVSVDTVSDLVEKELINAKKAEAAQAYIKYYYQKELNRKKNTTDEAILSTINLQNQEVKEENSNKNPVVLSTQRDYIAGTVSRDLVERYIFPKEVMEAHKNGEIWVHDTDYIAQHMHNCDLVNLEDMLQNGTVINGTTIEKPRSFLTACTITTQISAIVASSQFGGQTMTLSHLAPFVDVSRQRIRKEVQEEFDFIEGTGAFAFPSHYIDEIVEKRLKDEIKKGVQTIQYQILTISSTNG